MRCPGTLAKRVANSERTLKVKATRRKTVYDRKMVEKNFVIGQTIEDLGMESPAAHAEIETVLMRN